tara:strand:- start:5723 stop:7513 length:1791 start_codon:yes stop_codon:yes gene_type:complete
MDGYIQIYNGPLENDNIIFEEHNLIVDSASEHISKIFTYLPSPSSISASVTLPNSVAGITAISLGSAQSSKSYNILGASGITDLEAIPPVPTDTTIQPPIYELGTLSGPGSMGQFLNYIDFSGHYPSLTALEIKNHGCYIPSGGIFAASGVSSGMYKWLEIESHNGRGLAIRSDSKIFGWGKYAQYPGEYILNNIPTDNNFSSISLGDHHAVALTHRGNIVSWGGRDNDTWGAVALTPKGSNFTKVDAGFERSTALDSSGNIHQWGNTTFGGHPQADPPDGSGYIDIAESSEWTAAIDGSGYIHVWGYEKTHLGDTWSRLNDAPDTSGWTAISLGEDHGLALSGTHLTSWGNPSGTIGTPSGSFTSISGGYNQSLALSSNGAISQWGVGGEYGTSLSANSPDRDEWQGFSKISAGTDFNLTLSGEYLVSGWGNDAYNGISNIPASGIVGIEHLFSGTLNDTSSINSEGYILESRVDRDTQTILDASAGFVVSGIGTVSSTREVKYILTLNHDEWHYLNKYYGGIGSIGLWTLNIEDTLKKYPEGTTIDNIDLYNLADTTKNPVFKLFSKKVFLPGGLQLIDETRDSFITIVWSIKF